MANPADINQLRQICQSLNARAKTLQAFTRAQRVIQQRAEKEVNQAQFMENLIRLRFLQERTNVDGGSQWAARKEQGDGHPVLRDTGKLLQSAVNAVKNTFRLGRPIRWNIARVISYGVYHQQGTDRMVARKFFNDPTMQELKAAYDFCVAFMRKLTAQGLGIKGTRR